MSRLEQAGIATLGEHFQLKIEVINPENKETLVFFIYTREIEKAVKCPPYYAKVFRTKNPEGSP
jgi:hypothetical protein